MTQAPKNNKFRKKRSRLGQENPQKVVEPIDPNSEAESQTKYTIYECHYSGGYDLREGCAMPRKPLLNTTLF